MSSGKRSKTSNTTKRTRRYDDTEDDETLSASTLTTAESQKPSKSNRQLGNVGVIESLSLTNFMCHSKLDFDFDPNINIVKGCNGSGKSAVLTGLVVGLGGTANITSRGTNLKAFIKSGKLSSTVKVCLGNRGPDAFKPNEYGPVITVERRILNSGQSTYKIIGSKGNVISHKKDELLSILDQFNIQVENPVSILNQNTSRNFLNSKSPKDRYTFFMKATQLDQIKHSNMDAVEKLQVSRDLLARKQECLPEVKRELDLWERKYKLLQSIEDQENKLQNLKIEYAWALVSEAEQNAEKQEHEFKTQSKLMEKFQACIQKVKDSIKGKNQECNALNKKLQAVTAEIDSLNPEDTLTKKTITEISTRIRKMEGEKTMVSNDLKSSKREESSLQKQINDIRRTDPQAMNAEAQQRREKIYALEIKKGEYEAQKKTTDIHCNNLRGSVSHHQEAMNNLKQEERSLESQITNAERRLKDFESSRKNKFIRYGSDMPNLINQIEQAFRKGEFLKKPIGPIGAHIALREQKWAVGVEKCLGRLLESFCCDNHHDEEVLRSLINKTIKDGNKPSIIVSIFQPKVYEVARFAAVYTPHCNILDMLIIKDPSVANCLIDQRIIESVLLIEDKSEARNVMTLNVPKNCKETFTIEGDQVFPVPSFRYYTNTRKISRYLQGSVEDKIIETKHYLEKLNSDLVEKKTETAECNLIFVSNRQQLKATELQEAQISQNIAKLSRDIYTLSNFAGPEPVNVSSLEEEVMQLQQKQSQFSQQLEDIQNAVDKEKIKKREQELKSQTIDSRLQELFGITHPLTEQLTIVNNELDNLKSEKLRFENKVRDHEKSIGQIKTKWEQSKIDAQSRLEKTAAVCGARKLTRKSPAEIQTRLQEIEKNLLLGKKSQVDPMEVTQRYLSISEKYNQIRKEINVCEQIITNIEIGIKQRHKAFIIYRENLALRVSWLFENCLRSRNFRGHSKFNHQSGSLLLEVQPRESSQQTCTDMRSLSGGERSFATICFIISLWEIMESPFRILDEYDVFMDMVTRRISMDMMLDIMKDKLNQFIILTPLEMDKLGDVYKDIVKISKMPDPERGISSNVEQEQE